MCSRAQKCKCKDVQTKQVEKDEGVFHSKGNQCLGTFFVFRVKSKKQSVHPEFTVSLNYGGYFTVSAYIRTGYWKVKSLYCQFTSSDSHMCINHTAGVYESHLVYEMIHCSVLLSRLCCLCGTHPSVSQTNEKRGSRVTF